MAEQAKDVIVNIKNQEKKTTAMELIFFPIIFMIFIGVIFNNFNASGLQANGALNTTQFTRTDTSLSRNYCILGVDPNCSVQVNPMPTGCAANPQNCNASALTGIQFLNPNSPFTYLLEGNLVGFLSSIFNNQEQANQYYSGITLCVPLINGVFKNVSNSNSTQNFECFGTAATNGAQLPLVSPPLNASSAYGNNSIWNIKGCTTSATVGCFYPIPKNQSVSIQSFYGIYIKNGSSIDSAHGCTIYGSVQACYALFPNLFGSGTTFTCPNTSHLFNITDTITYCLLPTSNPATFSVTNSFSFFAFFAGAILLFMGFGFNIAFSILTNGGSLGINEQGTKLAQVLGIGLTIWAFISSEFGWIFVTNFSLSGSLIGTIISLGLAFTYVAFSAMFFIGLYWRMFSLE